MRSKAIEGGRKGVGDNGGRMRWEDSGRKRSEGCKEGADRDQFTTNSTTLTISIH